MRVIQFLLPLVLAAGTLAAAPEPPAPGPKEIAIDELLSERGPQKDMDAAVARAKAAGVGGQAILEGKFLYHIDRREDAAIAAMLPEFLARKDSFQIGDSAIFSVKEDWLAVIEYVRAIDALQKGEKAGFKDHITEAFWLSPRQAAAFAPQIERMRLEDAMRAVKVDFATKLRPLGGGDAAALSDLMKDRKAMVMHFWSPANPESAGSLPDYAITAKALGAKGIAMVSLLPDGTPAELAAAREALATLGENPPGSWLLDRGENPYFREMRVRALPTFVLISKDGRILYNGDPGDDGLWDALARLDADLIRPAAGRPPE